MRRLVHERRHGLDDAQALALARILNEQVETGKALIHQRLCIGDIEPRKTVPCRFCDGKGTSEHAPHKKCWVCDGDRFVEAANCEYPFDVEYVKDFIAFLMNCGGFSIC
jgi:hypothetical protein